jgi:hypothetical protein
MPLIRTEYPMIIKNPPLDFKGFVGDSGTDI